MRGMKKGAVQELKNNLKESESRNLELQQRLEALEESLANKKPRDWESHASRNDDVRVLNERYLNRRDDFRMQYKGPLDFDPSEIPDGMIYIWAREHCKGVIDSGGLTKRVQGGWTAVPASRHPNRQFALPGRAAREEDGILRYGDLILMERPKELDIKEKKYWKDWNSKTLKYLPGLDGVVRTPENMNPGMAPGPIMINEVDSSIEYFKGHKVESGLSDLSFGGKF